MQLNLLMADVRRGMLRCSGFADLDFEESSVSGRDSGKRGNGQDENSRDEPLLNGWTG
jgi:hypothetical protein